MFLSFSFHGQSLKRKLLWAVAKLEMTKEHFLNTKVFLDQAAGTVLHGKEKTIFLVIYENNTVHKLCNISFFLNLFQVIIEV